MSRRLKLTPDDLIPDDFDALPPHMRHAKIVEILQRFGINPLVGADGQFAIDLPDWARAFGMTLEEAAAELEAAGISGSDRDDLVPLQ
jgi:hypothetical protein